MGVFYTTKKQFCIFWVKRWKNHLNVWQCFILDRADYKTSLQQWGAAVVDVRPEPSSAVVLSTQRERIRGCLDKGSSVTDSQAEEASPSTQVTSHYFLGKHLVLPYVPYISIDTIKIGCIQYVYYYVSSLAPTLWWCASIHISAKLDAQSTAKLFHV